MKKIIMAFILTMCMLAGSLTALAAGDEVTVRFDIDLSLAEAEGFEGWIVIYTVPLSDGARGYNGALQFSVDSYYEEWPIELEMPPGIYALGVDVYDCDDGDFCEGCMDFMYLYSKNEYYVKNRFSLFNMRDNSEEVRIIEIYGGDFDYLTVSLLFARVTATPDLGAVTGVKIPVTLETPSPTPTPTPAPATEPAAPPDADDGDAIMAIADGVGDDGPDGTGGGNGSLDGIRDAMAAIWPYLVILAAAGSVAFSSVMLARHIRRKKAVLSDIEDGLDLF